MMFAVTGIAEAARPTQARGDPRLLALAKAATTSELCQRERAGADDRPADVVLDELSTCLAGDALEIAGQILERLLAAPDGLDVEVVQRDTPFEERHQEHVVEGLRQIYRMPLLARIDAHDLVAEIFVLAADVGVSVMHVVVRVLPGLCGRGRVPVPYGRVDFRIVHPIPLPVHDVVPDLHVLENLGDAEARGTSHPGGLAGGTE